MAWGRIDDDLNSHPKVLRAIAKGGPGVMGLWVMAMSYSKRHRLGGFVPREWVAAFPGGPELAHALVDCAVVPGGVGLWTVDEDGWRFWQWAERNRGEDPEISSKRAEAGRVGGFARQLQLRTDPPLPPSPPGKLPEDPQAKILGMGSGSDLDLGGRAEGGGRRPTRADLEEAYRPYPHKEGKAKGMALAAAKIRTMADLARLARAVRNYAASCAARQTEQRYIKHFSTFMSGHWEDWVDYEAPAEGRRTQPERDGRAFGVAAPGKPSGPNNAF